MTDSIVIDTNIVSFAAGAHGESEQATLCTQIIFTIISNDDYSFALDTNGLILDEYKRNLNSYENPHTKLIQEYIEKQLRQKDGLSFYIPIDKSKIEELEEMGFHDDDIIFLRIAPLSDLQTVASCDGDSFHDEDYKDWIENEFDFDVDIVTIEEAKSILGG